MRTAQPFPNPGVNVSQFTFPKRRVAYRVVSLVATAVAAAAAGAQVTLAIEDGVGNTIASWSSPSLAPGQFPSTITFSEAPVDASTLPSITAGQLLNVGIPRDLWVQPQWSLEVSINPNAAGDALTNMILQLEEFADKKPLAKAQPTGQES